MIVIVFLKLLGEIKCKIIKKEGHYRFDSHFFVNFVPIYPKK